MIVEETEDGSLTIGDPLAKGIVIFPENQAELNLIEYLLTEEGLASLKTHLNERI